MPTRANQLSGADWLKNSFSIWRGIPKDPIGRTRHPAAFPVSLIEKILDCYAPGKESLILDPFVGSGSTLIAATNKGMPSIGLDVNAAFREVFINRLDLFYALIPWRISLGITRRRPRTLYLKDVAGRTI